MVDNVDRETISDKERKKVIMGVEEDGDKKA